MNKAAELAEIEKSLEAEIGRNIHQSKRAGPASSHPENVMGSADDLGLLFRRVAELSTREIENLIDELHRLRKKLEADGDLIERAIARHAKHSQGVMQLTTIIGDNVKRLPTPTS